MIDKAHLRIAVSVALVLAGFATKAHAAPTPITTCTTLTRPGSYVLANNLVAAGDCLVVAAQFVTIDLAGFVIAGNGTGTGLQATGLRLGISISNGTIARFFNGVDLQNTATNVYVEKMRFVGNSNVGLDLGDAAIVKDSVFSQNGTAARIGFRSVVRDNTSNSNQVGFIIGGGSTVVGNVASINTAHGFIVSNGSSIVNNSSLGNTGFGMYVVCPSNIIENTSTVNGTNLQLEGSGCSSTSNVAP